MLPEPPSFGTLVTVWVRRIYGSERGDTTTRESRIKREIGVQIQGGDEEMRTPEEQPSRQQILELIRLRLVVWKNRAKVWIPKMLQDDL
jgi:hypothetical protein